MGWTTPVTWTTSLALSVARLNEQLRDNLGYLYDNWPASGWGWNFARNGHFAGWQAGTSSAPDAWAKTGTGAAVAQESTTIKVGTFSAKLTNGAGNSAYLAQSLPAELLKQLLGRQVTLGAWVYCGAASRAKLILVCTGGTNLTSGYHTGGGGWEFITVSGTVGAATTAIAIWLQIDSGAAINVYFDGVILTEGNLASHFVHSFNDFAAKLLWRQDNAAVNYRLGGGLLMQIGASGSGTGDVAVTFPVAFSVAPYIVLATDYYRNARSVEDVATTGFTTKRVAGSSSSGVYWLAIGLE